MGNKVYVFACRLSKDAESIAQDEIDRERHLYNQMIGEYNPHPRQKALTVVARHKLSESPCYTGSYFAAKNDFERATSAKRPGTWPGDPYRFRSCRENDGANVGVVFMKSCGMTWGKIASGSSKIFSVELGKKFCDVQLKIAREHDPIRFTCHVRREIPADAIVTGVYLARVGNFATRHHWELRITFYTEAEATFSPEQIERVGIDVGWLLRKDLSVLVAVTSTGDELCVPPYAYRMARKAERLQCWRDNWANAVRKRHPECPAKSANGTASWCEQHFPESELPYILGDRALHCRQDHVRERYLNIRKDAYRKFAHRLGRGAFILKPDIKKYAEEKNEKGEHQPRNHSRVVACVSELLTLLRQAGAAEVNCERLGDEAFPIRENAENIALAGLSGNLLIRAARKPVRKLRKRLSAA